MREISVIGAGVIGAAIAYELSRNPSLLVTLFDQKQPASGATGAALGILMGVISRKTKGRAWRYRQTSLKRYETLIPELEALTGVNIPWNTQGILQLCSQPEDWPKLQKLQTQRQQEGWVLELWDREKLQKNCPHLQLEGVIGAVYSPQDRQINPTALTQALIAGVQKNGGVCRFGEEVQEVEVVSTGDLRHCTGLHTPQGYIPSEGVIITAGLGSSPLTAHLQSPVEIHPVLGQALRVKVPQTLGNPAFQPVITGNDLHIAPLGEGEYWVGATVEFPKESGEVVANAALLEELWDNAIARCPAFQQAKILHSWSGLRPRPQGRPAPIIEPLAGYNNVWLASGHYRNGILLAPATALEIVSILSRAC